MRDHLDRARPNSSKRRDGARRTVPGHGAFGVTDGTLCNRLRSQRARQSVPGALSGAIVALAFVGQAAGIETAFFAFGIAVLLPLLVVGLVTFTRVVQTGIEDAVYARRIERIRQFYVETSPVAARYLDPADDRSLREAIQDMGTQRFRGQMTLTAASMVAVVNGAVAGAGLVVVVVAMRGELSLGIGAALGAITLLVTCVVQYWYQLAQWQAVGRESAAMAAQKDT